MFEDLKGIVDAAELEFTVLYDFEWVKLREHWIIYFPNAKFPPPKGESPHVTNPNLTPAQM